MRISDWSSDVCSSDLVVQLQCFSVDGPKSRILKSLYGDTDLPIGSHHWTSPNRPVVVQATRVAAVRGRTVTLGDPLLHDVRADQPAVIADWRSEEHTSELQSIMRISYAVFCLKKNKTKNHRSKSTVTIH